MKQDELLILGLAGLAVFFIVKATTKTSNARGLSSALAKQFSGFEAAGGVPWADSETGYISTYTSAGPLNLATYDKQIYD